MERDYPESLPELPMATATYQKKSKERTGNKSCAFIAEKTSKNLTQTSRERV